jgi:hypothetical protein
MEWLNWKTLLALAVLTTPLAYCEMDAQRQRSAEKIVCIENGGEWRSTWGGTCEFKQ